MRTFLVNKKTNIVFVTHKANTKKFKNTKTYLNETMFERNHVKTTSVKKKIDDDVMSENCHIIAIFSIYGQFGAIRKADCGRIVCKTYIFINTNFLSYKNWKQI